MGASCIGVDRVRWPHRVGSADMLLAGSRQSRNTYPDLGSSPDILARKAEVFERNIWPLDV